MHKILLALSLAVPSCSYAATVFSYTFDNNLQGWGGSNSGAPAPPAWQASNGNPGGFYRLSDNFFSEGTNTGLAQATSSILPGSITPDASLFSLDVRVPDSINVNSYSLSAYFTGYDATNGAFAWSSGALATPTSNWQTIAVPMSAFRCSQSSGGCGPLSEVTGLWIDLSFSGQTGNNPVSVSLDLDNIMLSTNTPEPSLAGLMGTGLTAMAAAYLCKRRRGTATGGPARE